MFQLALNHLDSSMLIEEVNFSDAELLQLVDLNKAEETEFIKFNNARRKKEWLSVRHLLKKLCKDDISIIYNDDGKPGLSNGKNISISHSGNYIGIVISDTEKIGLDIEKISKKIEKIQHKFINEHEQQLIQNSKRPLDTLTMFWCAKEAMYKMYSKRGLIFDEQLLIQSIDTKNSKIHAEIHAETIQKVELSYFKVEEYFIVWIF